MKSINRDIFLLVTVVWLLGLITFLIGSTITIFFFEKLNLAKASYYIYNLFNEVDSQKYTANYTISQMVVMFAISFFLFLMFKKIVFLIPKLNSLEKYYISNLNLLNHCLTIGVVFFGFFPLFLSFINFGENLLKEINVLILIFSTGFFVPYISVLIELIVHNIRDRDITGTLGKEGEERILSNRSKIYKLVKGNTVEESVKNRNSWTFTIATLGITGTICYLFITGKVNIDSSTLLSLILAFFSIYLSAQFYFKSTEQSNKFYDRSFNHTKNIAESLAGMNSEVTKSLKYIEQHNLDFRNKLDNISINLEAKQIEKQEITDDLVVKQNELIKKYKIEDQDAKELISRVEEVKNIDIEINKLNTLLDKNKNGIVIDYNKTSTHKRFMNYIKKRVYDILSEANGVTKDEILAIINEERNVNSTIVTLAIRELYKEEQIFENEGKYYTK